MAPRCQRDRRKVADGQFEFAAAVPGNRRKGLHGQSIGDVDLTSLNVCYRVLNAKS